MNISFSPYKHDEKSEENCLVKYLDETWANEDKAWVEKDKITGGTTG